MSSRGNSKAVLASESSSSSTRFFLLFDVFFNFSFLPWRGCVSFAPSTCFSGLLPISSDGCEALLVERVWSSSTPSGRCGGSGWAVDGGSCTLSSCEARSAILSYSVQLKSIVFILVSSIRIGGGVAGSLASVTSSDFLHEFWLGWTDSLFEEN